MIPFRRPTLADRDTLQPLFLKAAYRGCEYSFANIYLWGQQQVAIVDGALVIFAHWDGRSIYLYPESDRLEEIVDLLAADARERGIPLRLYGLTQPRMEQLEAAFPGRFGFTTCRDSYDYLYDINRLADLKGKKMQQKRNHINRFLQEHAEWTAEPITAENLDECRRMAAGWYEQHALLSPTTDYTLEKLALRRAFDAYDILGMEGLLIRTDGRIVAMTMGNRIGEDTYDVNFEKADPDIPGAYPLINREFARLLRQRHPELRFLNREDDMGLPGLRKAKESYHPDELLEKFRAYVRAEHV